MSEPETETPSETEAPNPAPPGEGGGDEPEQGDEGSDDDEDAATTEPEPDPEPDESDAQPAPPLTPQPAGRHMTPEALEKRAKSAETRFATYARGVRGLYEDEAENLLDCPLCPTFHKGMVDARFAGMLPEDVADAVRYYLGVAREKVYKLSRTHTMCGECDGEGKVQTGSHVPGHAAITCTNCKGYGYMPPPASTQTIAPNGTVQVSPEAITEALQSQEDVDEWGEPRILPDGRENPNFGRMPNRKILVEPYGVTANLNAHSVAA